VSVVGTGNQKGDLGGIGMFVDGQCVVGLGSVHVILISSALGRGNQEEIRDGFSGFFIHSLSYNLVQGARKVSSLGLGHLNIGWPQLFLVCPLLLLRLACPLLQAP
jgi:hypothetical protein